MTRTLAGADIRGYYAELGVQIPDWARTEATVRCFAAPDTHRRADHDPSVQRQPRARRMALPHLRRQRRSVRRSQGPGLLRPRSNRPDGRVPAHRVPPTPASQRQGSMESRVDLWAPGQVSARAAARDQGRHRPLAGRTRKRHRPHRQAQPWPGLAVRHDARARAQNDAAASPSRFAMTLASSSASCATSRRAGRASRRCSRPRAHAERCCRTPPPSPPCTCYS